MIERFISFVLAKLNLSNTISKESRTGSAMRQMILGFAFRLGSVLSNFILVPVTLNYLNKSNYGVWLTLNSMVGWLAFFDVGMGNGMKNKLSEAFAEGGIEKAKSYISSTYFLLGGFLMIFIGVYALFSGYIHWDRILNSEFISGGELATIAFISISLFCGRLVADLILSVLAADQRTGEATAITFVGAALTLLAVYIIAKTTASSLLYVSIALSGVPVAVSLLANIYLYARRYQKIRPSFKWIRPREGGNLLKLSLNFFIIQIAALVIFSTDNFIVMQLYGPEAVTSYNIVYKYFSVITVGWAIVLAPYWTAFSSAYLGNDFAWIKKTIRNLMWSWLLLVVIVFMMLIAATFVYRIWIGKDIQISFELSFGMGVFVLITALANLFVILVNATGKIRVQLYTCVVIAMLNIPMAIFFAKTLNMGVIGVVIGNCVSLCVLPLVTYIQGKKILKKTDTGIWGK